MAKAKRPEFFFDDKSFDTVDNLRSRGHVVKEARATMSRCHKIELTVHENTDGSHRVQVHSEELDALPVFQVLAEMLPRILSKMSSEEVAQAREILADAIKELIPESANLLRVN